MRVGGKKDGKQYKGIREGGINENTAYYIFTHASVSKTVQWEKKLLAGFSYWLDMEHFIREYC